VYPDLRTTASDYIARARTLTIVYSSNYQVSILSCPWTLQLSCTESLHLLGHSMTAAVFRDMIQGTHKFVCLDFICTIFSSWFSFLVVYKSAWYHIYDTFHMLLYNLLKHMWQVKVVAKEQNCHYTCYYCTVTLATVICETTQWAENYTIWVHNNFQTICALIPPSIPHPLA
jgi:hypothetical protein